MGWKEHKVTCSKADDDRCKVYCTISVKSWALYDTAWLNPSLVCNAKTWTDGWRGGSGLVWFIPCSPAWGFADFSLRREGSQGFLHLSANDAEPRQGHSELKHWFFMEQWKLELTQFFLLISVLATEKKINRDLTDTFLDSRWNIFYRSSYSACIRRAKASWLAVFWLSNRAHTLTLKDYKKSDPIWVCSVHTYEAITPQCSQRPWLQNILRTELVFANLNPVIPILPQKECQWLTLPFSWVWGLPISIPSFTLSIMFGGWR